MHASTVTPYRLLLLRLGICLLFISPVHISAQPVSREATAAYRQKTYRNIVQHTIQKNLSVPLTRETEDQWKDALSAMLLLQYQSDWTQRKIFEACSSFSKDSSNLFIPIVEYLYAMRVRGLSHWAYALLQHQSDPVSVGIITQYLLASDPGNINRVDLVKSIDHLTKELSKDPTVESLKYQVNHPDTIQQPSIDDFFRPDYLPGQVLLLCLQRTDRNYPGLILVRDTAGQWLKDSTGKLASISILARSQNNLPGYFSNGNTPEGLFRMDGFAQSASGFIGPSTNIQLTMPFEYKAGHFYNDSTLSDSSWSIEAYDRLLPAGMRGYFPAYESYRAGKAGRREIIIHGSTVDPSWYRSFPFFPFAPTLGCLTTKESWDPENGQRVQSDQQNLVDLVIKAGGPHGYLMVLNLNSRSGPVSADEIQTILQQAGIQ